MAPPSAESLAGMGLLGRRESILTEFVSLREDAKRQAYYDKFIRAYASVEELNNVRWCTDSTPSTITSRCNGNIVLLEIGARVPAAGDRQENLIPGVIVYPKTALGEWGLEYLTVSHSTYKGMDRILISEPAKMKIPRYFEYLPKKIHDTLTEEANKFVREKATANPGLAVEHVTSLCTAILDWSTGTT